MTDRLADVQPGSRLAEWIRDGRTISAHEVARVTKTVVICTDGTRWNRRTGRAVGDTGSRYHAPRSVRPWRPEHSDALEEQRVGDRVTRALDKLAAARRSPEGRRYLRASVDALEAAVLALGEAESKETVP